MTDLAQRGPMGLKPLKADKPKSKGMRRVSAKRAAYLASDKGKEAFAYMGDVKCLPCAVCGAPPPSIAHHCIHGRFSTKRASDFDVIPLCTFHHDHGHPEAIHTNKAAWAAKHGPDTGFIQQTRARVKEMRESIDF